MALGSIYRFFFGEDFFISYGRADAVGYAEALANRLVGAGFTCFLDQWQPIVDANVPPDVLRALRSASTLVIVATTAAASSKAVEKEVIAFSATGRPIVPIDIAKALDHAPWASATRGVARSVDSDEALTNGQPSNAVVERLVNTFEFRRRTRRVRMSLGMFALASIAMAGVSFWQTAVAQREALRAEVQANAAEARGRQADSRALSITSRTQRLTLDQRLLLAAQAWSLDANLDARDALGTAVRDAGSLVRVLYSPDPVVTREIVGIGLRSDGHLAVAGYADGSLVAWTLADGRPIAPQWQRSAKGPLRATGAAISADGMFAAVGHADGSVELIPIRSGGLGNRKTIAPGVRNARLPVIVSTLVFSPDGSKLAVGWSDGRVRIFDTRSLSVTPAFGDPFDATRDYHRLGVIALAWRRDSEQLVSSHGGGRLMFWSADGAPLMGRSTISVEGDVSSIEFDAAGGSLYLSAGRDGNLKRVSLLADGLTSVTLVGDRPMGSWSRIALGAGGRELLVQPLHGAAQRIALDGEGVDQPLSLVSLDDASVIAVAPDSHRLIAGFPDGTLAVYDLDRQAGARQLSVELNVERILFDQSGTWLHIIGTRVESRPIDASSKIRIDAASWEPGRSSVLGAEGLPSGLMVHRTDGRVWLCKHGQCLVTGGRVLGDSDSIWQGSESLGAWQVTRGQSTSICRAERCYELPNKPISMDGAGRYALARRGTTWAHSTDRKVFLCRADTCRLVPGLEEGSGGWIGSIAVTPDDKDLVIGTSEGRVRFVSVATGADSVAPRTAQRGAVTKIAFDSRGTVMATGGRGGSVLVWDLETRRPIGAPLQGPNGAQVFDIALSPSGDRLATLYSNGQLDIQELSPELLVKRACAIAGRTFSINEWQLLGGGPQCPATCAAPGSTCAEEEVRATVHR